MQFAVGDIVEGKVTGVTTFGAFVALPEGKTGLVHISEISHDYVRDINDYVKDGQIVSVKIMTIEPSGKISLSIRKASSAPEVPPQREYAGVGAGAGMGAGSSRSSFEDKLKKFIKESEEKQGDVRRNVESKRGSGKFK
jgi:S1 RNA binding domain protein